MATTIELRDRVLAHQFSPQRYGDLIIQWLDEAQTYILRESDIRTEEALEEISTVAGVPTYPVPSSFRNVSYVYEDETNTRLEAFTQSEFEDQEDDRGTPIAYVIRNEIITLYPTPDAVYSIKFFYYKLPLAISATSDPEIPADYHDILVDYALWRAYLAEHDYEAANMHQTIYLQQIEKMKGQLQSDAQESPSIVPGGWWG